MRRSKGNLKKAPQRKKEAAAANKEGGDYFAVEVLEAHQQDPWLWHVGTGNHGEGASVVGQAKYTSAASSALLPFLHQQKSSPFQPSPALNSQPGRGLSKALQGEGARPPCPSPGWHQQHGSRFPTHRKPLRMGIKVTRRRRKRMHHHSSARQQSIQGGLCTVAAERRPWT